jgi:hypothetical protein
VADWAVEPCSAGPFRYVRILQFGVNADGGKNGDRWHCLAMSGIELYGELTCVDTDTLPDDLREQARAVGTRAAGA